MSNAGRRRYQQGQPSNDWLDRLTRFNLHFGRYFRDVFGVLLLAIALMSLLALWGWTRGVLLTPWAGVLAVWLGWGSYLLIAGFGYAGFALLRRDGRSLSWGRVLCLELASLLTLGLLSVLGGNSLVQADAGMYGGRLGWGIAYLLGRVPFGMIGGGVLLFILWLLTAATGFGLWSSLETWLLHLAGETAMVVPPAAVEQQVEEPPKEGPPRAPRKKTPSLPPEFPPSLKAPDRKSEKPVRPVPREEGLPPLNILMAEQSVRTDERTINQTAGLIMKTLSEFGIPATVIGYRVGPAVTQFAVQPGFIRKNGGTEDEDAQQMKVRVAQIANLQKDLALALSARPAS